MAAESERADIFISYAREDEERAERLAAALLARGWSVFWDRNIPAGQTWDDHIGRHLDEARCVVVGWSNAAVESKYVREEAREGRDRDILVPAFFEQVRPPFGFRGIHAANLTRWHGEIEDEAFQGFVAAITAVLGSRPPGAETDTHTVGADRTIADLRRRLLQGPSVDELERLHADVKAARIAHPGDPEAIRLDSEIERALEQERRPRPETAAPARGRLPFWLLVVAFASVLTAVAIVVVWWFAAGRDGDKQTSRETGAELTTPEPRTPITPPQERPISDQPSDPSPIPDPKEKAGTSPAAQTTATAESPPAAEPDESRLDTDPREEPTIVSASKAKQHVEKLWTDPVTGMQLAWVPGGCFEMGNPSLSESRPVRKVCVEDFWLGKYEVTEGQWLKVMGSYPQYGEILGDHHPVAAVSWYGAQEFITKLNRQATARFRLPSEAEWEYACRSAGQDQTYCGGEKDDLDRLAWFLANTDPDGDGYLERFPVGTKEANALGLHDMSGNLAEWVQDCWKDDYRSTRYFGKAPANGSAWEWPDCNKRVLRGGALHDNAFHVKSYSRLGWLADENQSGFMTFRLAMDPK